MAYHLTPHRLTISQSLIIIVFFIENDDEIRALMNRDFSYEDVHLLMEVEYIYISFINFGSTIYIYMCILERPRRCCRLFNWCSTKQ